MQSLTRRSFDWILAIMLCLVILESLARKRKLIFLGSHSVRRCEMKFTSYGSVVHPGSHWLRSLVFLIHTFVKSSGTLIGDRILCSNVLLLDMRLNCLRHIDHRQKVFESFLLVYQEAEVWNDIIQIVV